MLQLSRAGSFVGVDKGACKKQSEQAAEGLADARTTFNIRKASGPYTREEGIKPI